MTLGSMGPVLPAGSFPTAQPELAAGELRLRPWIVSDAPQIVRAYDDPDIRRWHCRSMTLEQATAWVAEQAERWQLEAGAGWAVTRAGVLVGRMGLRAVALAEGAAEVGYWVVPEARGHGVATAALRALVDWAFRDVGFHRLELNHSTLNPASCRVALAAGFVPEGTKRQQAMHLDGWHDMHAHARLQSDPRPS